MKVIAIMGSPMGKGQGYGVVKQIEETMKKLGDVEFEHVFLKEADLQLCKGCFVCISRGEDKCPLKDDRAVIEKKLLDADGIILSSPVYVQNVSWVMKNFIDRFAYTNHRLRFFGQKGLLVANGGMGQQETIKSMRNALGGMKIADELAVYTPEWKITRNAEKKRNASIERSAKKFYEAMSRKDNKQPSVSDLMRFLFLKEASGSCKKSLKADYEYFKDREYFYDVKIGPVKKTLATVMVRVLMSTMRDLGPETNE